MEEERGRLKRISVEGNIAAGKSTLLRILSEADEELWVVPEPMSEWREVGGECGNLLRSLYEDPRRWAYTFQSYAFLSRIRVQTEPRGDREHARVYERTMYSDTGVFGSVLRERGALSETEWRVYRDWQTWLLEHFEPELHLNGVVCICASTARCAERLAQRGRNEERGISLEYLAQLHERHEAWLCRREPAAAAPPVLVLDGEEDFERVAKKHTDAAKRVSEFIASL